MFAWSYKKMLVLDPKIVVSNMSIKKGFHLKSNLNNGFSLKLIPIIKKEENKLNDAGFIHEVKYPTRLQTLS